MPEIHFILHKTLPGGFVTGRNCCADLPLGTLLTGLYRRDYPADIPMVKLEKHPDLVFVCDLFLQLDSIEMFNRPFDLVPSGYTAMLHLSGNGFETVADFVSTATKHTTFSLCALDESYRLSGEGGEGNAQDG